MWNLTTLCSAHHKSHHEGLLTIRGEAPLELEFTWSTTSSKPANAAIDPASQRASSSPAIDQASQRPSSSSAVDQGSQLDGSSPAIDQASQRPSSSSVIDPTRFASTSSAIDAARHATRPSIVLGVAGQPIKLNPPLILETARHDDADDRVSTATIDDEARTALVTAGYKSHEARVAVKNARPHVGTSASLEQVLREALRQCALMSRISHQSARGNSC